MKPYSKKTRQEIEANNTKRSQKINDAMEKLTALTHKEMMHLYKKTLKEQRPFWKKQRRDWKKAHQLPSDVMWEARKFSEAYRKPFRQPYGQIQEMFRQATDESTLWEQ